MKTAILSGATDYSNAGSSVDPFTTDFQRLLVEVAKFALGNQVEKLREMGAQTHRLPDDTLGHSLLDKYNTIACEGPAGEEVRNGGNVKEVAGRYGLTEQACFLAHGFFGALETNLGVTDDSVLVDEPDYGPRSGVTRLEEIAVGAVAGKEVADGANLLQVAHKYGIRVDGNPFARLARIAVQGPGRKAVLAGGRAADFLASNGISKLWDCGRDLIAFEKEHLKRLQPQAQASTQAGKVPD
ncbi:hypothetical protein [Mitsuaria sp. 7]|uniref:hypothetical protein n=1 Tax=Mitsuaria sp. 7 TaxID=1658665 RepID=UPI0007DCC8B6|nr:hypothetical protein [Mitsuaria sp. 7]ANH67575.1 hypothetical protein ABE85_08350 [Mitsuaria sp. 7]